ncbi:MAG TPA: ADP-ribosyl-[dinitrogen reductase] hydrolase [Candidatus Competibacteraceae bacterium]|nr:ADP-ribosyl-[dinitrogen reductase] hydrolase [Candidatus Competibacteraceae bacterium]
MEERTIGAYLGLAVGDALGATVEFLLPREIQALYGVHDRIRGGGWLHLKPGQVTDDTGMALALGDCILERGEIDALAIAGAFDAWLRSKPVDVGHTIRRGILHFRRTGATCVPENHFDAGNGACMRVLPVALATLGQPASCVQAACRTQTHVTHNNPLSDAGVECMAFMIQAALRGASRLELLHGAVKNLLTTHPLFRFRGRRRDNPSAYIVETLQAVFQALFDTNDFRDCLVEIVNRGGDADTTSAIAGMIAGALYGVNAIPDTWLQTLDAVIRRRCLEQARQLLRLALAGNGPSGN